MRKTLIVMTAVVGLVWAPASATAGPPNTGCPKGFYLASVDVLGTDFTGVADNVNHDGMICLKDLANGGIFVDNTMP